MSDDDVIYAEPTDGNTDTLTAQSLLTPLDAVDESGFLELIEANQLADAESLIAERFQADPKQFRDTWQDVPDIELNPNDAPTIVFNWLRGYRRNPEPLLKTADIPIYELHCPAVPGCSTRAVVASKQSYKRNLSIKVLGLKTGEARTRTFAFESSELSEGECYTIFMRADLTIYRWNAPNNPAAKPVFTLATVEPVGGAFESIRKKPVILGTHYCGWDFDSLFRKRISKDEALRHLIFDKDYTDAAHGSSGKLTRSTEETRTFSFPMTLNVPEFDVAFPIDIQLGVTSTIENSFSLEYDLDQGGGYQFRAFTRLTDDGPVNWIWRQRSA